MAIIRQWFQAQFAALWIIIPENEKKKFFSSNASIVRHVIESGNNIDDNRQLNERQYIETLRVTVKKNPCHINVEKKTLKRKKP